MQAAVVAEADPSAPARAVGFPAFFLSLFIFLL